ncbi:MAG: cation:proton antiporter [Bacilli bacterium]|nr:cation:proton antiporter [Bacilli bacterium]
MNESLIEKIISSLGINSGQTATVIISIAVILLLGFLATRLTKKIKLPNVTAYLIVGILLVPIWDLIPAGISGIIPKSIVSGMDFLADIALAFIAFGAGEFFRIDDLKKSGMKVIIITLFETLMAIVIVFCLCFFALKIDLSFSLLLATLASATAPTSTIMTIKQTKAKGEYVNNLVGVIALDDVFALILYSVMLSICLGLNHSDSGEGINFASVGIPILKNLLCIAVGGALGYVLKLLMPVKRTTDNRLIIVIAILFAFCGLCAILGLSPLLGCMAMGMVYINVAKDEKLFKQLNYFQPPIMLCFFVMSGMKFNLRAITNMTMIGLVPLFVCALVYFFGRMIGKYAGVYLGALVTKSDKSIRNYLAFGLMPQASVAIGLVAMGARVLGGGEGGLGDNLQTIILAAAVLYEIVGPAMAKLGLYLSKSYSDDIDELVPQESIVASEKQNDVDILIEQIKEIQKNIPTVDVEAEEEAAFTEAADEYFDENFNRRRFINRR